jgi:Putative Ig domain
MRVCTAARFISLTTLLATLLSGVASAQIGPGGPGALAVTTNPALPSGTPGSPYSVTLAASEGLAPYQWVAVDPLPPGFVLSSSGVLSGTPSTANRYAFTIQVSDSSSPPFIAEQIFYLTIGSTPLACSGYGFTPTLRSEGLTEAVGDIFILCVGGASAVAGQPVPQVNVTVSFRFRWPAAC